MGEVIREGFVSDLFSPSTIEVEVPVYSKEAKAYVKVTVEARLALTGNRWVGANTGARVWCLVPEPLDEKKLGFGIRYRIERSEGGESLLYMETRYGYDDVALLPVASMRRKCIVLPCERFGDPLTMVWEPLSGEPVEAPAPFEICHEHALETGLSDRLERLAHQFEHEDGFTPVRWTAIHDEVEIATGVFSEEAPAPPAWKEKLRKKRDKLAE